MATFKIVKLMAELYGGKKKKKRLAQIFDGQKEQYYWVDRGPGQHALMIYMLFITFHVQQF